MKLTAKIDGETRDLTVTDGEGVYTVTLDGVTHHVDARPMEGSTWSLLIDGHSYEVDVVPDADTPDDLSVRLRGQTYEMTVLDERRMRMREATGAFAVEGRAVVRSPMPGKLVRTLVAVGDEVEEHQGLVVVEAMKMENELRAPKAGTVVELPAEDGQLVEGNAVLVVIE